MKKLLPWACAITMTGSAITLWYAYGLSLWTLALGLLLLACPIGIVVVTLRERRRAKRHIQDAEQALHGKHIA